MKKILIMLFVCTFIMTGCKSQNNKPVEDNDQTQVNTDEEKKGIYIDTNYFTVTLPDDWEGLYDYEIISGEMDNEYSVVFYEKESHKEIEGGFVFGISLYEEGVDYTYLPSYEELGILKTDNQTFNVLVEYPTDVQFTEDTSDHYHALTEDTEEVINSIQAKEGCTFTKK